MQQYELNPTGRSREQTNCERVLVWKSGSQDFVKEVRTLLIVIGYKLTHMPQYHIELWYIACYHLIIICQILDVLKFLKYFYKFSKFWTIKPQTPKLLIVVKYCKIVFISFYYFSFVTIHLLVVLWTYLVVLFHRLH